MSSKMNITTEALKVLPKYQFDVSKGSNLKMQFKYIFRRSVFAEMINQFGHSTS